MRRTKMATRAFSRNRTRRWPYNRIRTSAFIRLRYAVCWLESSGESGPRVLVGPALQCSAREIPAVLGSDGTDKGLDFRFAGVAATPLPGRRRIGVPHRLRSSSPFYELHDF